IHFIEQQIFLRVNKSILWALCIFIVVILVYLFIVNPLFNKYENYKCSKEPEVCQPTQVASQSCFPLNNLNCKIIETAKTVYTCSGSMKYIKVKVNNKNISDIDIKGGDCIPFEKIVDERNICGYQEANAWFNQWQSHRLFAEVDYKMECN
ncbi:MAG: hypothetical protein AABY22_33750, partial [Nanoarchaeota archaeon]